MHFTKNGQSLALREKIIPVLADMLADALDLQSQCKQAHWNVRGAGFMALHEMFDKLSAELDAATDTIAERIVQLGGTAAGTVRLSAAVSRLKEYPLTLGTGDQHVEALSSVLAIFNVLLRHAIDEASHTGDAVTTDLLTSIARGLDKQLWFIEAHLPIPAETQSRLSSVRR